MRELQPCSECHRHVASEEQACPFCGAAIAAETPRAVPGGKLTRAAIFAGALAGATALGCGPTQTRPDHPPPPPPPAEVADAGAEEPPPPPPTDAAYAKPPPPGPADAGMSRRIPIPNKPYGAPPARRRLV